MPPEIDLTESLRREMEAKRHACAWQKLILRVFRSLILAFIIGTGWIGFFFFGGGLAHATWNCIIAGWHFFNRF